MLEKYKTLEAAQVALKKLQEEIAILEKHAITAKQLVREVNRETPEIVSLRAELMAIYGPEFKASETTNIQAQILLKLSVLRNREKIFNNEIAEARTRQGLEPLDSSSTSKSFVEKQSPSPVMIEAAENYKRVEDAIKEIFKQKPHYINEPLNEMRVNGIISKVALETGIQFERRPISMIQNIQRDLQQNHQIELIQDEISVLKEYQQKILKIHQSPEKITQMSRITVLRNELNKIYPQKFDYVKDISLHGQIESKVKALTRQMENIKAGDAKNEKSSENALLSKQSNKATEQIVAGRDEDENELNDTVTELKKFKPRKPKSNKIEQSYEPHKIEAARDDFREKENTIRANLLSDPTGKSLAEEHKNEYKSIVSKVETDIKENTILKRALKYIANVFNFMSNLFPGKKESVGYNSADVLVKKEPHIVDSANAMLVKAHMEDKENLKEGAKDHPDMSLREAIVLSDKDVQVDINHAVQAKAQFINKTPTVVQAMDVHVISPMHRDKKGDSIPVAVSVGGLHH